MATKKSTKEFKPGDYVNVKKGVVGVVTGIDKGWDDEVTGNVYVEHVDKDGESWNNMYESKKLTAAKAPEYVVVWTNDYSDPFTQFATKPEAEAFAAKLRKRKDVVEVRMYKLTH